jgi:branched-chain amino acid transport system permease protein
MFLQQLINGLTVGSVYALIALGYTMVYGIIELINFAHGEIYMLGAYMGIIAVGIIAALGLGGLPVGVIVILVLMFSMAFVSAAGVTLERVAYKPLRHQPRLAPLISAMGASIFLQNTVMVAQGADDRVFPELLPRVSFSIGNAEITLVQVFIFAVSVVMMVALAWFINKTKTGTAMRGTAQDKVMAALVGINVNRVIAITFFIGSALAAVAGVMVGIYYGRVNFFIGYIAGLKAFTAAVLGGIGNIAGAMLGGLMLGLVESFGAGYLSAEYKDVYAFVILVLVLIVRPQGLLRGSDI